MASQSKTSTAINGSVQTSSSFNRQFHSKNIELQERNSINIIAPPPGNIQKKNSSTDEDVVNETSLSPSNPDKTNNKTSGRWTKDEHKKFIEGIKKYGRNWKKVEDHIGTRTGAQIRSHAQKFFNRLEKEQQNNSEVSEQSRELLEIMNNSSHNANVNSTSLTKINSVDSSLLSVKKSNSNKNKISNKNTHNCAQNQNQSPSNSNYGAGNSIYDQQSLNYDLQNSNNDELDSNYENQQEVIGLQNINSLDQNGPIDQSKAEKLNQIYKKNQEESNETTDYNQQGSNNQLKIPSDQNKQHLSQSPHRQYFPSKFGGQQVNQSTTYNKFDSPILYPNYFNNSGNNYNNSSNQYYNQNSHGYTFNNGSTYSYQQIKGIYDERDLKSEEALEKYSRQQETQDNSFFREHNLGNLVDPKLYDLCEIVQQNQNSNQLNYQSESYIPNFKRGGRSRFGSFKLYDEENESSNQKYQNFRKASIDDQELKKKLKLNDGSHTFISNSNKVSPDSQVLN